MKVIAMNGPGLPLGETTIILLLGISLSVTCLGFFFDLPWAALLLPGLCVISYMVIFHLTRVFRFLFFLIPLSMEIELPGGLSTDFPAEPILWLLFIIVFFLILFKGVPRKAFNTITILLGLHITWILIVSLFGDNQVIAFKYSLAKLWYILPFYLLPFYLVKKPGEIRVLLKYFIVGVICAALYFFVQHYAQDLTFMSRTNAGKPIWRNHVNYACTLVVSLPIILYLWKTSRHPDRWIYLIAFFSFLVFIYFSYARIAYICIVAALAYVVILKLKCTKLVFILGFAALGTGLLWLAKNNNYVHLAPQYDKAIMQLDFERKIAATTGGEDISTMERLHRWVAGQRMIKERPLTGFGPANFYRSYRPYTIYSFETYVSNNPEKSGIHNYYLMVLVEQGYIGLTIFISLLIALFIKIEQMYHLKGQGINKDLILLVGIVITMIVTINLVNDMIEVIKIGSIFFFLISVTSLITKEY